MANACTSSPHLFGVLFLHGLCDPKEKPLHGIILTQEKYKVMILEQQFEQKEQQLEQEQMLHKRKEQQLEQKEQQFEQEEMLHKWKEQQLEQERMLCKRKEELLEHMKELKKAQDDLRNPNTKV